VVEEGAPPSFHLVAESGEVVAAERDRFNRIDIQLAEGVQPWMNNDVYELIEAVAERLNLDLADASEKFSELRLRKPKEEMTEKWWYHPLLGVHSTLE
jgi:hypothetical protein